MKVTQLEIAVIPGDGIGKEVVPAALDVLRTIADVHGGGCASPLPNFHGIVSITWSTEK